MSLWQVEYRRWQGTPVGVWQRRWAIARYGLRLCLAGRFVKILLVLAAGQAVALSLVFVFLGQLATPDSALVSWLARLGGEEAREMLNALTSWALLYPEICVDGVYRLAFFAIGGSCAALSWVTIALFVHRLIANDLASQAIVIYSSKALTRWDYLFGKFAIVAIILSVIWLAPVALSWVLGNLLSPDWAFFWYSFPSLLRGLAVGGVAVASLSCMALGVSALAKRAGAAVAYWILGLAVLQAASVTAGRAYSGLRLMDPFESLSRFGAGVYRLRSLLEEAKAMLPFFDGVFRRMSGNGSPAGGAEALDNGQVLGPLLVLALFSAGGIALAYRRSRPA